MVRQEVIEAYFNVTSLHSTEETGKEGNTAGWIAGKRYR
jgi:hypothetical protein